MVKKITYPLKKKEEKIGLFIDNDGYTIQDEKIMGRQRLLVVFKSSCS